MAETNLEALMQKLITLSGERGLRMELEFDNQEVQLGEETLVLNGKTVVESKKQ
ncbi:MAG: hypothetical protein MUP66_03610 [Candidatus Nanohaloarchaeota archaeon QJJ-5]|nr:hypothetical protein [Candidatus Nanohaloarchaeota archaeon QJJ-5]